MAPCNLANEQEKELLSAQAHIWNHILYFLKSMALKCAIQLSIPDAIKKHGKPITLIELASSLHIPSTKVPSLNRLMRSLISSNFFTKSELPNGELAFDLNINSQLLLKDHPLSIAPFAAAMLDPTMIDPAHHISSWLKDESESPFNLAFGKGLWDHNKCMAEFNQYFNLAMASDARFLGALLTSNDESKDLFKGIESLVDVGGGDGTMARAIGKAFPDLKCIVLDQPHVVQGLEGNGLNLVYVGGNMFEAIPKSQVVLLKWILHGRSDEECVEILKRCKEAIPSKDEGGKVIIIDSVLDDQMVNHNQKHFETQILFDMLMMSVTIGGKERTEEEWKKLFLQAGFSNDYKISHVLGPRSIIQIYP